jgi:hypothetical protein
MAHGFSATVEIVGWAENQEDFIANVLAALATPVTRAGEIPAGLAVEVTNVTQITIGGGRK